MTSTASWIKSDGKIKQNTILHALNKRVHKTSQVVQNSEKNIEEYFMTLRQGEIS